MGWRPLIRGLRALVHREAADREIADEVEHYLEEATAERVRRGFSPVEARRAARMELGGATAVKEQVRGSGWENAVETVFADLRYAARRLSKNPGFAAAGLLTLALGIGASTAIFSVVHAVLLRALPYPHPDQVVRFWEQAPDGHRMNLAEPNFDDFRSQNRTFAQLAAYGFGRTTISGAGEPVRANIASVSTDFFPALGVQPFRGRVFSPQEQRPHGAPAIIVSYQYWRQSLSGTDDLSRFRLRLVGESFPVIGVMPEGFDFPAGTSAWISREREPDGSSRTAHNWRGIGRLREGATILQARADLAAIAHRIREQYGKRVDLSGAAVVSLEDALVGDVRISLLTLLGAAGLLLLAACANVAGLSLARSAAQRKELALRTALGAGRARLVQQFLAESCLLAVAGSILGFVFAFAAVRALPAILPANLPRRQEISPDLSVLLFALAAMTAVALLLGLLTAWRSTTGDLQSALTSVSRGFTGGIAGRRLRAYLVVGQIALALVILAGAGLLGRSFLKLLATNPGFDAQNLLTIEFSLPVSQEQDAAARSARTVRQVQLLDELVGRLRTIPGSASVGLGGAMPVAAGDNLAEGTFLIVSSRNPPANFEEFGRMALDPSQTGHALYSVAGDAYFRSLGIPMIRGRMFAQQDDWNSTHVALISETLARQRWPGQDPIGQVISFGNMDGIMKPLTIVGIVGDIRARGLDASPGPIIYVNYRQRGLNSNSTATVLMRIAASPKQVASDAQRVLREVIPDTPVKLSSFEEAMGGWFAGRRFLLLLISFFAAAALSLVAVGIYGVVAFSVASRTMEIGIRVALGGQRGDLLRLVMGEGAGLAFRGIVVGCVLAFLSTRVLSSLVFATSVTDPITFAAVAGLILLVVLLASYVPARRALRIDPNTALRYE